MAGHIAYNAKRRWVPIMPIKIFHLADIHLGAFSGPAVSGENARMLDTIHCMDFAADQAETEQPDVILISGDLFHKSKLWADQMLKEISIASGWLRKLSLIAPVVLMFGTESHDSRSAFENIRAMQIPNLTVSTVPELLKVETRTGILQVVTLPGFDKGYFRAQYPGMDATQENVECTRLLGDMVLGLSAQLTEEYPSVLMSHYTVVGCKLDNGEHVFQQQEVVLPREALQASNFDLVCLGHIHGMQEVPNCGRPTWYSGGINCFSHGEAGQPKGFLVHEIESAWCTPVNNEHGITLDADGSYGEINTRFIETPYRRFKTISPDEMEVEWYLKNGLGVWFGEDKDYTPIKDAIVRVKYSCNDDLEKQLNRKALEKTLYNAGAFWVSEIKREVVNVALIKEGMSENSDPLDNLLVWLEENNHNLEGAAGLVTLAKPLIDTVSAKLPTGKLSGLFVPRRITVKNYRSYREESVDLDKINFAVVTGGIGTGKSSLFMDAPHDCLFEEPREGELTGWIKNGEKSGMIEFEFGMGETIWKVVRTRLRSGKTTLSLQEQVEGRWTDRSEPKKDDTQKKIIALLGMDAMTFKCCALIMQGAYGLFLEANREDRMSVLGNILGLGVYEQLEKLVKENITDTNRELEKLKSKVAEIEGNLKDKSVVEFELSVAEDELSKSVQAVTMKELELSALEAQIRELQGKIDRAEESKKQVDALVQEIAAKEAEKVKQQALLDGANNRLEIEEKILAKAAEYEQVNVAVAVLRAKEPRLTELRQEVQKVNADAKKIAESSASLKGQVYDLENLPENSEVLERAAIEYRQAEVEQERQVELSLKHKECSEKIRDIERIADSLGEKIHNTNDLIRELKKRADAISNSGCIDPENATCWFLKDANESKKEIPLRSAEVLKWHNEREEYFTLKHKLVNEQLLVGYNVDDHIKANQDIKRLRSQAELAAALPAKIELLETIKSRREQELAQLKELLSKSELLDAEITTLTEELLPLPAMEERLPKLKAWVVAKDELPQARQIKVSSGERIEQLKAEIKTKLLQQSELELQIDALVAAFLERSEKKVSAERTREQLNNLRNKQNAIYAEIGGLKTKLEALEKLEVERGELMQEMEPKAKLLVQYQVLAKSFGQDGIPFQIVRSIIPELSAKANEILGQMTRGQMSLTIETDKIQKSTKKEINVLDVNTIDYIEGKLPYLSRSGGQKVSSALSIVIALSDLKANRAGIQLGMLFLDEPSWLSAEAIDAYCDSLEVVAMRNNGMKVVAMSHDPSIKSRFPQVITVTRDADIGSKVSIS